MVRKHEGVMCRGVETMQCGEGRECEKQTNKQGKEWGRGVSFNKLGADIKFVFE